MPSFVRPLAAALVFLAGAPLAHALDVAEPAVRETVIDDGRARIEERRVRGQLQKVTVAPKAAPSYEIVTGDGARDLGSGDATSRGAVGKRVWNVIRF